MESAEHCVRNMDLLHAPFIQPNISEYVYKLIYILEGSIQISFQTRQLKAEPGDLIVFSNYEPHRIEIRSPSFLRYFITLSPKQTDFFIKNPHLLSIFKNPITFNNVLQIPKEDLVPKNIFQRLLQEKAEEDLYSERIADNCIYDLLVHLSRNYGSAFSLMESKNFSRIYSIQQYIDDHFTESISVSELAKMAYMSQSYLTHSFLTATGYTPKQYQQTLRLSYAKSLLSVRLSVSSTAEQSGFGDVNNFIKAFKRQYSMTPGWFQKSL